MVVSMPRGMLQRRLVRCGGFGGRFGPGCNAFIWHHCNDIGFAPHNLALGALEACEIACYFKVLTPNAVP
jgi:hypothetical protein